MLLAWHFLALGVAVMVFLWMIFLHRRAQKLENHRGANSKANFPCAGFSATPGDLAGHPFGNSRSGSSRAGFEPSDSLLLVGRHGGRARIFHQPARERLGHRHRPRPAMPRRRRGRVLSFSDGVEPQARPRAVFSRGKVLEPSRVGARGRRLRDARVCVGGRNGLEPGREDDAGNPDSA